MSSRFPGYGQALSRGLVRATAVALALALVVPGCAPASRVHTDPEMRGEPAVTDGVTPGADAPEGDMDPAAERDEAVDGGRWECVPLAQGEPPDWGERSDEWVADGGSMFSTHRTRPDDSGAPGRAAREEAVADAVESAASAALDLLEQRGVPFGAARRSEIAAGAADAVKDGLEVPFPRIRVAGEALERCVSASGTDTLWSGRFLVEYPIGLLRGDANNVRWERRRAAREAAILISSAEDHLERGRLLAGLLDRTRAVEAALATGAPIADSDSPDDRAVEIDDALSYVGAWAAKVEAALETLTIEPVRQVEVLDLGPATDALVEFACSYVWNGRRVPAVGLPVRFELEEAGAVLASEPLTDGSGVARCRIAAAYGLPGEYELSVGVDDGVLNKVFAPPGETGGADDAVRPEDLPRGEARQKIYLVEGAHAVSVCSQFDGAPDGDIAQARTGFSRRLERAGYLLGECGADVDVIVRGSLSLSARVEEGVWTAEAVVAASAFDQRSASGLGETTITVTETSSEGSRESEVLALKEVGRLLAVYFEGRLLSPGD